MAFVALIAGLGVMAVLLVKAHQPWSIVLQRDREEELIFRGYEYTEAIRAYQAEHGGAYPTKMEDLLKPGQKKVPYLRRLYTNPFDPEEGKWTLLAPGVTVVRVAEDGTTQYLDQMQVGIGTFGDSQGRQGGRRGPHNLQGGARGGQAGGFNPGSGPQPLGGGQAGVPITLPFKIGGEEGQPILGVCALEDKKAFKLFMGKQYINEWFFSPLVVQPQGSLMQGQQGQTGQFGQGVQQTPTGGTRPGGATGGTKP